MSLQDDQLENSQEICFKQKEQESLFKKEENYGDDENEVKMQNDQKQANNYLIDDNQVIQSREKHKQQSQNNEESEIDYCDDGLLGYKSTEKKVPYKNDGKSDYDSDESQVDCYFEFGEYQPEQMNEEQQENKLLSKNKGTIQRRIIDEIRKKIKESKKIELKRTACIEKQKVEVLVQERLSVEEMIEEGYLENFNLTYDPQNQKYKFFGDCEYNLNQEKAKKDYEVEIFKKFEEMIGKKSKR